VQYELHADVKLDLYIHVFYLMNRFVLSSIVHLKQQSYRRTEHE